MKPWNILFFVMAALFVFILGSVRMGWADVVHEGEHVFLVDRTGERWDITQAVSIGFQPHGFQFGIGRDAIRPLDESSLAASAPELDEDTRVIGVENGPAAHAYVVHKLTRHEIANTTLGDTSIAAAY